jgi:citrate lyase subunit beta / citryl-CoA lyase
MDIRPRRSVLYMPGANARALEKARGLAADCLILDLEDAVAPDAKADARERVADAVRARGFGPREVVVRVNAIETQWGLADIEAAVAAGPDAILIPKVSRPGDIVSAAKILAARQAPPEMKLWAMMETPAAILDAAAIAAAAIG